MRILKLVNNMVYALDVIASKKYRIPSMWEGRKWFSEEIRKQRLEKTLHIGKHINTELN